MRVSAIHVSWADLDAALRSQGIEADFTALKKDLKGKELKRFFTIMSAKEASRSTLKQDDAFVQVVISWNIDARRAAGHKGVVTPTKASTAFDQFRVVAARIKALADDYEELPEEVGRLYFKRAIEIMGKKYNLSRLLSETTHDNVVADIEKSVSVQTDPNKELTKAMFDHYCIKANMVGKSSEKLLTGTAYSHFVDAAAMAKSLQASGVDWVDAQFEGLAFTGNAPKPEQLCTTSAEDRFLNYRGSNKEQKKENKPTSKYEEMIKQRLKK